MNKRKVKSGILLILSALAIINMRALFLFLMEFLSMGGMWLVLAFLYTILLLKGGKRAILCAIGYFVVCALLWISNAFYEPYGMMYEYDEKALISLSEKLIDCAQENYTHTFDVYDIAKQAPEIMTCGKAKVIVFAYPEILDRLNLSGIFVPFTGRAYINKNEKDFLLPFVAAHELSHREGILDEGQANVHAFIKCMESEETAFRYSASIYALKYALYDLRIKNEAEYCRLESQIPKNILSDLEKMSLCPLNAHSPFKNYSDLIPGLLFNQSITSQGVI